MDFVKDIINSWDPLGLLFHAPQDEYCSEIEEIQHLLDVTDDVERIAEGIFEVFIKSFGKETFNKSKDDCRYIAQTLKKAHGDTGQGDGSPVP